MTTAASSYTRILHSNVGFGQALWKDGASLESRKKVQNRRENQDKDPPRVTASRLRDLTNSRSKLKLLGWFIYPSEEGKWRTSVITVALQSCRELLSKLCRSFTSSASRLLLELINLRHDVTHDDRASTPAEDVLAGSNVNLYYLTTDVWDRQLSSEWSKCPPVKLKQIINTKNNKDEFIMEAIAINSQYWNQVTILHCKGSNKGFTEDGLYCSKEKQLINRELWGQSCPWRGRLSAFLNI